MLKLIPFLIFISYSVRTANIQPNPDDYEFSFGSESESYQIRLLTERENGFYYKGSTIRLFLTNWCEFEYYYKEAQQIDSQSLRFS